MKHIGIIILICVILFCVVSVADCGLLLFQISFDNGDLDSGWLTVVHGLGVKAQVVMVYNNYGEAIVPDKIDIISKNTTKIYIETYGVIEATWSVVLLGGK